MEKDISLHPIYKNPELFYNFNISILFILAEQLKIWKTENEIEFFLVNGSMANFLLISHANPLQSVFNSG